MCVRSLIHIASIKETHSINFFNSSLQQLYMQQQAAKDQRKRKDHKSTTTFIMSSNTDDHKDGSSSWVDSHEIMKLTKVAKSWEFTCSFCFKKFPSAQAMGGHQNAHRTERLEEKRLFVRDPISYRKRNYIKAMKSATESPSPSPSSVDLHEAAKVVKREIENVNKNNENSKNITTTTASVGLPATVNAGVDGNGSKNKLVMRNFLGVKDPDEEAAKAEDIAKEGTTAATACIDGDGDGDDDEINLDLTLKL